MAISTIGSRDGTLICSFLAGQKHRVRWHSVSDRRMVELRQSSFSSSVQIVFEGVLTGVQRSLAR